MVGDEHEQEDDQPQPPVPEIVIQPEHLAGVWANFAQVVHSEHEFTLDFVRLDYSQGSPPRRGIVVARIGFSPLFVLQLIRALEDNWAKYAEKAMPKEVRGHDEPGAGEGEGGGDDQGA